MELGRAKLERSHKVRLCLAFAFGGHGYCGCVELCMTTNQPIPAELLKALNEARDIALLQALKARIPECGHFADIAQQLDWLFEEITKAEGK